MKLFERLRRLRAQAEFVGDDFDPDERRE